VSRLWLHLDGVANDLSETFGEVATTGLVLLFCKLELVSTRLFVLPGVIEQVALEFALIIGVLSPTFFVTGVVTVDGGFFGEFTTFLGSLFNITKGNLQTTTHNTS
jgi:hypothetical protein